MSQPPHLAPDGSAVPAWAPEWTPPAPFPPGGPGGGAPAQRRDTVVLTLAALAGLLVGIVAAGLVVTVLFAAGAGRMSAAIAEDVRTAVADAIDEGKGSAEEGLLGEGYYSSESSEPVEEFPPTEPGTLGPDPVLDAYARGCFAGDFQACDDLYNTSPPLSRYEEYAATCGGRVKAYQLMSCTELE